MRQHQNKRRKNQRSIKLNRAIVRELFSYNKRTGILRWRKRARDWFVDVAAYKKWNTRFAGKIAGSLKNGYIIVRVFYARYRAHRLIFLYLNGRWPKQQIDHRNRKRADNREINIREATPIMNGRNSSLRSNNTTGRAGVGKYFYRDGWYKATIFVNKRDVYLGLFSNFKSAVAARKQAEIKYGWPQ